MVGIFAEELEHGTCRGHDLLAILEDEGVDGTDGAGLDLGVAADDDCLVKLATVVRTYAIRGALGCNLNVVRENYLAGPWH